MNLLCLLLVLGAEVQQVTPEPAEQTAPTTQQLDAWIAQLGAKDFHQRLAAERKLGELAKAARQPVRQHLALTLEVSSDPEIAFRLKRLLRTIAKDIPVVEVEFSQAKLADKTWQLWKPPTEGKFSFKRGVLQIDSLPRLDEALTFVHRLDPEAKPGRLVLDAEIKLLQEKRRVAGVGGVHLNIEDAHQGYSFQIQEGGVYPYQSGKMHKVETVDHWHHYRLEVEGQAQKLYVDDMEKPISVRNRRSSSGRQWVSFGDGTGGAGVRAEIRNVIFRQFESSQ